MLTPIFPMHLFHFVSFVSSYIFKYMDMGSCGIFSLSTVVCLFILISSTLCQNLPYGSGASISNVNNSSSPLSSSGGFDLQSLLSSLSHLSYSDVVRRAGEALQKLYLSGNVSSICLKDLQVLFDALMSGQQWALRSKLRDYLKSHYNYCCIKWLLIVTMLHELYWY